TIGGAGGVARSRQYGEDRRVRVIEADRAERVEPRQIIGVRRVVAMPGDDVERRVVELGRPEIALELGDDLAGFGVVLKGRHRGPEVAWVGEAVGADRSELGQPKQ